MTTPTVTNVTKVILNILTSAEYQQLVNDEEVSPTELYMTTDDVYLTADDVVSTYSASGTEPVNGIAIASALANSGFISSAATFYWGE